MKQNWYQSPVAVKPLRVAAIVGGLIWLSPALAQEPDIKSGNYWHQHCRNWQKGENSVMTGICAGMVSAALGYANLLKPPLTSCPPTSATNNQAVDVVVRYLDTHPQSKHLEFQTLVLLALSDAWPCR